MSVLVPEVLTELRPYERVLLDTYLDPRPRERVLDFTLCTFPTYRADPVHALLSEELGKVLSGETKRLMIFAPPQHGKTELVSVRFPPLWLAHHPDQPIILTSYGAQLAYVKSREARNVVESTEFQGLFPEITTDPDSRAGDYWRIMKDGERQQGGVLSAGVAGPITGHGAGLGIIDDPYANWEQAQSPTIRRTVWNWWQSTFRTRIWEGGAVVLIMTRWHEDDLAGKLLKEQGDKWRVVRLPALAESDEHRRDNNRRLGLPLETPDPLDREPGEPLAPQLFSTAALEELQDDTGSMAWNAEYQGVPRAPEGNTIKREWFETVSHVPDVPGVRRVRYWDKGGTEAGGAFTAGVLIAAVPMSGNGREEYYIEDVVRGQWSPARREDRILEAAEEWADLDWDDDHEEYEVADPGPSIWIEQEPGSGGKESMLNTVAMLTGFTIHRDLPRGSKDVRLQPFISQAERKRIRLVRGPWNTAWLDEMCAIPNSTYRDQADATAGAFSKVVKSKRRKVYHGLA